MSSFDLISMSLRNLIKRKLRTFLTILGVVVGTAAIVVMISLGIGMNKSFEDQVSQMGDLRVINVQRPWDGMSYSKDGTPTGRQVEDLDDEMIELFSNIPGVKAATPIMEAYLTIKTGKYISGSSVRGVDPNVMDEFGFRIGEGRLLNSEDTNAVVFGSEIKNNFYNPKQRWTRYTVWTPPEIDYWDDKFEMLVADYWDESVAAKKYKPIKIEIVGVLQQGDWNTAYYAFMNINEMKKVLAQQSKYRKALNNGKDPNASTYKGYEQALVKVTNLDDVVPIMEQIQEMGFYANCPTQYLEEMKKTASSLQALLGAIGAVSLFVAAIGIANTMMMSIYERTREIGIMKVIGAALSDIRRLFLVEASVIGFLGGLLGVGLSYLISFLLNKFGVSFTQTVSYFGDSGSVASLIPLWLSGVGLGFATVVGIISGYLPARRAMKLDALAAIRSE